MINLHKLCCENLQEPLGISNNTPRFSWNWTTNLENSYQKSWRIQVAEDDAFTSCAWDSGDIFSDQQLAVVYSGKPLSVRTGYFWRVKIATVTGECSDWSSTAYFETGFFSIDDWDSFWFPHDSGGRRNSTVNHFRKEFQLPAGRIIVRARAYIGATCGQHYEDTFRMNLYVLRLNGHKVGADLYNPGQLSSAKGRALYRTYDIQKLLEKKANTVGIIYAAERISMQLRIEFSDGSELVVNTGDAGWKWNSKGPFVHLWYKDEQSYAYGGRGEVYDANAEFSGWDRPGFDDSKWTSFGEPLPEEEEQIDRQGPSFITAAPSILKAQMQSVQVSKVLSPKRIYIDPQKRTIVDFGQVFNGHERITLRGKRGNRIIMRFGECLFEDGSINFCTTWGSAKEASTHEDVYIKGSNEPEIYSPSFANHAFRYMEITGLSEPLSAEDVCANVVHSTVLNGSDFVCGDPQIMKLHDMSLWSSLANLMSVPTDCPGRERQGWISSGGLPAATECVNFDMRLFYEKWFDDVADSQYNDGLLPVMCPPATTALRFGCELLQTSLFFVVPTEAYLTYGDPVMLSAVYPVLRKVVEYINRYPVRDGLSRGHIIWNDWKGRKNIDRIFLENTAICHIYSSFIQIAEWLEKETDAARYRDQFEVRKNAVNRVFMRSNNRYGDLNLQSENIMALAVGIVPVEHLETVTAALTEDIESRGCLTCGAFTLYYLLKVLSEVGRNDLIWQLMQSDHPFTIGYWAQPEHDLTCLPESWTVFDQTGEHVNHHDFDSFDYWFYRELVGLKPLKPGYKEFAFEPYVPKGLNNAHARINSVYGEINAKWVKTNKETKLYIEVPNNTTAYIHLPGKIINVGSGKHQYHYDL